MARYGREKVKASFKVLNTLGFNVRIKEFDELFVKQLNALREESLRPESFWPSCRMLGRSVWIELVNRL